MQIAELEALLEAAGVPRSLWPKFIEREEMRKLRRRLRDADERRRTAEMRAAQSAGDKARQRDFYMLVMLLIWLIKMRDDDARRHAQICWTALRTLPLTKYDSEKCQRMTACTMLACYDEQTALDALQHASTNLVGDGFPLHRGIIEAERALEERGQREAEAEKQQQQQERQQEAEEAEELDEEEQQRRQQLAAPEW